MTLNLTTSRYPTCRDIKEGMKLTTWYDFGMTIMYEPHGTVHNMVGGIWNPYEPMELLGNDVVLKLSVNGSIDTYDLFQMINPKGPWSTGALVCPSQCSEDTPADECVCSCSDDIEALRNMDGEGLYEALAPLLTPTDT